MPKAYVSCDFLFFPDVPYGGQAIASAFGDEMFILVKELPPNVATKEVRDARNAENYQRTIEWVRAQRVGR